MSFFLSFSLELNFSVLKLLFEYKYLFILLYELLEVLFSS